MTLHTKRLFLLCYLHIHSRLLVFLNSKFDNFVCEHNLIHEKLLHPKNKWGFPMQYLESAARVLRQFGPVYHNLLQTTFDLLRFCMIWDPIPNLSNEKRTYASHLPGTISQSNLLLAFFLKRLQPSKHHFHCTFWSSIARQLVDRTRYTEFFVDFSDGLIGWNIFELVILTQIWLSSLQFLF